MKLQPNLLEFIKIAYSIFFIGFFIIVLLISVFDILTKIFFK